jgi:hypothetical protein
MGDWDCDGIATPDLFRTSDAFAYLRNSNSQGIADIRFFFGNPSDIPLAGDFNGDGCDTLSIYRPSNQTFYIVNELGQNEGGLGPAEFSFVFGNPGDKPFTGDFDGDGITEVGLHRESTGFVYYRNTLTTGNAENSFFFGDPGDRFVTGDWSDAEFAALAVGTPDTPAIFRPGDATFYFRDSNSQGNATAILPFGAPSWLPVSGDTGADPLVVQHPDPIATGTTVNADGFQVEFVIFESGGVVEYEWLPGGGIVGGFEATECVYQEGNNVWAIGRETHHSGGYQGAPFEGSEYVMLSIEDNAATGTPDLRDIRLSDPPFNEFDGETVCDHTDTFAVDYPAGTGPQHVVVEGDVWIRP